MKLQAREFEQGSRYLRGPVRAEMVATTTMITSLRTTYLVSKVERTLGLSEMLFHSYLQPASRSRQEQPVHAHPRLILISL